MIYKKFSFFFQEFILDRSLSAKDAQIFIFASPISMSYIRVYPKMLIQSNTLLTCIRLELIGCQAAGRIKVYYYTYYHTRHTLYMYLNFRLFNTCTPFFSNIVVLSYPKRTPFLYTITNKILPYGDLTCFSFNNICQVSKICLNTRLLKAECCKKSVE